MLMVNIVKSQVLSNSAEKLIFGNEHPVISQQVFHSLHEVMGVRDMGEHIRGSDHFGWPVSVQYVLRHLERKIFLPGRNTLRCQLSCLIGRFYAYANKIRRIEAEQGPVVGRDIYYHSTTAQ